MRVRVEKKDMHLEQCGTSIVPVLHRFECIPPATQIALFVNGNPPLREGDRFEHTGAPDHIQPKQGSFVRPPAKKGSFTAAGQDVLNVDGVSVVVSAGRLETCSDGAPEVSCEEATRGLEDPLLFINGKPVLAGRSG